MAANLSPAADIGTRIMAWHDALAVHTEQPGMLTRTYLTEAHHAPPRS